MNNNWTFNKYDQEAAQEIRSFLPAKIFDIHAHIYRIHDLNPTGASMWTEGPEEASIQIWRGHLSAYLGENRLAGGLFFPVPMITANLRKQNDYLIEQLEKDSGSRGLILVSPDDELENMIVYLNHPQVVGFKIYHIYSKEMPTWQSSISGFCPDWMWAAANERSMIVMLHIVKDLAIADSDNVREIRELCTKFPSVKLVLAHAARCFHAPNAEKGISGLRGLENVYFDTSAVCEPEAMKVILQQFGPRKLLWGSDFPVSQIRGKSVTVGDGFAWLEREFCNWDQSAHLGHPILAGIESLRALRNAANDLGLNEEDLNDIFYSNASRLLQLEDKGNNRTNELYLHAKTRIPGGGQLLSKRPENMAPGRWPAYFREARGCEVWDLDGKHYYDMSTNGVGSCLLGYRDPDVTQAVVRRVNLGSMSSLNAPEEVELADMLCDIHPWAEQVRFARGGGDSCAVAVRIARATTDRSVVAICGYHGWQDWYLSANLGENDALRGHLLSGLNPKGVPSELRGTTVTFKYNDRNALNTIIDQYGSKLAAVIMEPCRYDNPEPGFLQVVRESTRRCGALLIFDEITIGWRLHYGGAHLKFEVTPDIAVFAKALGNGHPIGAIIGTEEAMQGAHESFISSTYWTESVGPAAAIATVRKLGKTDAPAHVERIGSLVMDSWRRHGEKYRLPVHIDGGYPCLAHFSFKHEESEKLRTMYTQMMLDRGFLAGTSIYPTLAHNDDMVHIYDLAIDEVFAEISDALKAGDVDKRMRGNVALSGFQRLI
ncbi:aminotransferase class III-fold pyridoxal phosphate-dependent enzyme [Paenibacillus agricola]|uniref:Aminotransferase class III-fold pyridoxal phosphate-dependent enzyme n=1 Tax=Paenibacillus agricola TaxID=2716264 RepID=A0ABX0JAK4_9BACL|nr:aminotransferase class III-fold pyridoxal phosphate-dependent enzyme [Paenibacillus agricola]NHN32781.1 aminotransferase class III-fold pyridoxal phosphate-dependent enzyme [Paenibacillus agricola]